MKEVFLEKIGPYTDAENRNYNAGFKSYCNWGLVIQHELLRSLSQRMTFLVSPICIAGLLVGAFFPQFEVWSWVMVLVVLLILGVPAFACFLLWDTNREIERLTKTRNEDYARLIKENPGGIANSNRDFDPSYINPNPGPISDPNAAGPGKVQWVSVDE